MLLSLESNDFSRHRKEENNGGKLLSWGKEVANLFATLVARAENGRKDVILAPGFMYGNYPGWIDIFFPYGIERLGIPAKSCIQVVVEPKYGRTH